MRRGVEPSDSVAVCADIVRVDVFDLTIFEEAGHEGVNLDELHVASTGKTGPAFVSPEMCSHSSCSERASHILAVLLLDRLQQTLEPFERGRCGQSDGQSERLLICA